MSAVEPAWCFVQGRCADAKWSDVSEDWWVECTAEAGARKNPAVVRAGEIGRIATPPPYIKYYEEEHDHGANWDWVGRLNTLYPANKVPRKRLGVPKVQVGSGADDDDDDLSQGSGELSAAPTLGGDSNMYVASSWAADAVSIEQDCVQSTNPNLPLPSPLSPPSPNMFFLKCPE